MKRKATLTIEVDVVADMCPGAFFTFDDHVAYIARELSRNHQYFTGMRLSVLHEAGGDPTTNALEVKSSNRNINQAWEGKLS